MFQKFLHKIFVFNGILLLHPAKVILLWEGMWLDSCILFLKTFPQSLHSQGSCWWIAKCCWKVSFLEKIFPHKVQRNSAIIKKKWWMWYWVLLHCQCLKCLTLLPKGKCINCVHFFSWIKCHKFSDRIGRQMTKRYRRSSHMWNNWRGI